MIKFQLVVVAFALSCIVLKYLWTFCVRLHNMSRRWLQDDEIKKCYLDFGWSFYYYEDLNQYIITELQNSWVLKGPLEMI